MGCPPLLYAETSAKSRRGATWRDSGPQRKKEERRRKREERREQREESREKREEEERKDKNKCTTQECMDFIT